MIFEPLKTRLIQFLGGPLSDNKNPAPEATPAELEAVVAAGERLRSLAAFYVKFDAALFAGLGTLITIAKPDRQEIVESLAGLHNEFTFLILCLGASLTIHHFVSVESPPSAANIKDRRARHTAWGWLLLGVLVLNAVIVSGVTGYITGGAEAAVEIAAFGRQRARIESALGRYRLQHGRAALILDSALVNELPAERTFQELGGAKGVRYEIVGGKEEYRLTFAGWDKVLGTTDDYESTYVDWITELCKDDPKCSDLIPGNAAPASATPRNRKR